MLVIGAGVTGCAVARELSRYDLRVTVLERSCDEAEGATKSNSANVLAGFDAKPDSNKARFNVLGNALFEPLCRDLPAQLVARGCLFPRGSAASGRTESSR